MELKLKTKRNEVSITAYPPMVITKFETSVGIDAYETKSLYQDGTSDDGNTLQTRSITIELTIVADSKQEYDGYRRKIIQSINPKEDIIMHYVNENKQYKIKCNPTKLPYFSESGPNLCKCLISLKCNDPYWKDTQEISKEIALWINSFEFELEFEEEGIEFGYREPSLLVNMLNESDASCGMLIRFEALGTLINPSLLNVDTQEFIKLNYTMRAGETIEINTEYGNKYIHSLFNGIETSLWNYKDYQSTFLQMNVGDNLFRYDATQNLENLNATIYFTQKYLEF